MVVNLKRYRFRRVNRYGEPVYGLHRPRRTRINANRYRVFLNGHEVTDRTFYVDSRRGVVRMYLHGSDGRPYTVPVGGGRFVAASTERRGRVRLVRRRTPLTA